MIHILFLESLKSKAQTQSPLRCFVSVPLRATCIFDSFFICLSQNLRMILCIIFSDFLSYGWPPYGFHFHPDQLVNSLSEQRRSYAVYNLTSFECFEGVKAFCRANWVLGCKGETDVVCGILSLSLCFFFCSGKTHKTMFFKKKQKNDRKYAQRAVWLLRIEHRF